MIDPVIFTIGNFSLRWYGVIVMIGVIAGSLIVENELKRRGEDPDSIWDALIWPWYFGPNLYIPGLGEGRLFLPRGVLVFGIIGARLWYVLNATLGGDSRYINDPSQIYKIWEGGLHIYGGLVLGAITLLLYLRSNKKDPWLFLDAAGPAMLIGQAIGRVANFINQELYGPPTDLPWGIKIEAGRRLPEFSNLTKFPVETTRFHPTFAYEMIWNFLAAGFLLWLSRRYEKDLKPGTLFSGWLVLAGVGRAWIEYFRPDQPKIPAWDISYTTVAAALMAITGLILLLARYKAVEFAFAESWEEQYQISQFSTPIVESKKKESTKTGAKGSSASKTRTAKTTTAKKTSAQKTTTAKAKKSPTRVTSKSSTKRKTATTSKRKPAARIKKSS